VILSARGLAKSFSQVQAVQQVDLDLRGGDVLGIVGPNGAGKTTLLRMLAGVEKPDSGIILLDGQPADEYRLRRSCTLTFQVPVMFSGSVFDNVAYGLKLRRLPREEVRRRAMDALEQVELAEKASRNAKTLSGGEQQRVSIARALALDTDILLMDEPTSNLDPRSRLVVDRILGEISQGSRTAIIATHDISHAGRICNRLAFMDGGRIVSEGRSGDILRGKLMKNFTLAVNVFSGESEPVGDGLARIALLGGPEIQAVTGKKGPVIVRIRPEDVVLSTQPVDTSARNRLRGPISTIVDEGATVLVGVDVGTDAFARISHASLEEMDLRIGREVWLLFKASSVEVM